MGDFADILESGKQSDVTIRVNDKEFRLHRSILSARNPYFRSMFRPGRKKKNIGIVCIDGIEPDIVLAFLQFLYTGKVHRLSSDNVCDVFEVADTFRQDQLKEECTCYMINKISVASFFDVIVLALKYSDKELLQAATDLFCRKTKEIIQSVQWLAFMREYPTEANQLHIAALDFNNSNVK